MKCKPFNAMSMGIFGNVELTISWRSNSFSSTKWSSLPPPLANLKGMLSPVWKPYRGYKGNQEINKHLAEIHLFLCVYIYLFTTKFKTRSVPESRIN